MAAAEQSSRPAEQNGWTPGSYNRTAVAEPSAVAKLAAALLNVTAPEVQPAGGVKPQVGLPRQQGRLLVKFKELYGNNYSAVAQLVNEWAGIDLIQVGSRPPSPHNPNTSLLLIHALLAFLSCGQEPNRLIGCT